jgi:multicomponent Na+:H+ antiporter subunit B
VTGRVRLIVFGTGALLLAVLFGAAVADLPAFGTAVHAYRDIAVAASLRQQTANVVASLTFDLRGLDTFGEEVILLGSVVGAVALLRPSKEDRGRDRGTGEEPKPMTAIPLVSYVFLPLTLLIGLDLVVHGHLTPGGGFQGGVVLATGLHLLYLADGTGALRRLRPLQWYEWAEGLTTAGFGLFAIAGMLFGGGVLANFLPRGHVQQLLSAGTVPLLNALVGVAVGAGSVVLLAQFITQAEK